MWWTTLKWIVFGMALAMLGGNMCKAAPAPRNEDMFRELMKLDQLYSSIARPSLRSLPMSSEVGQKVQRALNMLRLQELDNLYSSRSRPRFGKRGEHREVQARTNTSPVDYDTNQIQNGSQLYDIGNAVGQSLSAHEKINFLSNTWIPDSKYVFPLKQEGKQQMRKFGVHWLQQYNWLAYSESKTGGFCKFCVLFAPDGAGMGSQYRSDQDESAPDWLPLR